MDIFNPMNTTTTLIIDQGKFALDELLCFTMAVGSWLTGHGAEYTVTVDHDCYVYVTMDADVAAHFAVDFAESIVTKAKIAARSSHLARQVEAMRDVQNQQAATLTGLDAVIGRIKGTLH